MNSRFSMADLAAVVVAGAVFLSLSHAIIGAADDGAKTDGKDEQKAKARRDFLGSARAKSMRLNNATQIRGIHIQLVVYANANNQFYPGRTPAGANNAALKASEKEYGAAAPSANDQSIVLAILLNWDAFAPEYLISPFEAEAPVATGPTKASKLETVPDRKKTFTVSPTNCSYAMLSWAAVGEPGKSSRRDEWLSTQNGLAPVVADRSKKIAENIEFTSVLSESTSDKSADWVGFICWNDNSTRLEKSAVIPGNNIKIGTLMGEQGTDDDLFLDAAAGPLTKEANVVFSYTK